MEQKRGQFTFYESFATALKRIRKASERCAAYDAIVNYALYGDMPELDKLGDAAAIAFSLIRPHLDTSRHRAVSGRKGGLAEILESKNEANDKQNASEKENKNENEYEYETETETETETESEPEPEYKSRGRARAKGRGGRGIAQRPIDLEELKRTLESI